MAKKFFFNDYVDTQQIIKAGEEGAVKGTGVNEISGKNANDK